MLIAHTESRQRVKFAREHVVAAFADTENSISENIQVRCFIFSLVKQVYQKTKNGAKKKISKKVLTNQYSLSIFIV